MESHLEDLKGLTVHTGLLCTITGVLSGLIIANYGSSELISSLLMASLGFGAYYISKILDDNTGCVSKSNVNNTADVADTGVHSSGVGVVYDAADVADNRAVDIVHSSVVDNSIVNNSIVNNIADVVHSSVVTGVHSSVVDNSVVTGVHSRVVDNSAVTGVVVGGVADPMTVPRVLTNVNLTIDERMKLVSQHTVDCIGLEELRDKMQEQKEIIGYLGTAPTRSPSIGYFIPMMKFRDLVNANINMILFIADVHAFLDKGSKWIDKTLERTTYYIFIITEILKVLGINPNQYTFMKGSDIQLDKAYIMDLLKLMTTITVNQAKKAGSEVVKQNKDVNLSSLIYPLMQVIDAATLNADIEIGGLDQRKIFALGRDSIESLGYDKCCHVMNELLPSLGNPNKSVNNSSLSTTKMSSSDLMGKIEFTDTKEMIAKKINKAYCVEKEVKDNPCLALARLIIYPINYSSTNISEQTYQLLEKDWIAGNITAIQLKEWLIEEVNVLISPIRKAIESNREIYDNAFYDVGVMANTLSNDIALMPAPIVKHIESKRVNNVVENDVEDVVDRVVLDPVVDRVVDRVDCVVIESVPVIEPTLVESIIVASPVIDSYIVDNAADDVNNDRDNARDDSVVNAKDNVVYSVVDDVNNAKDEVANTADDPDIANITLANELEKINTLNDDYIKYRRLLHIGNTDVNIIDPDKK